MKKNVLARSAMAAVATLTLTVGMPTFASEADDRIEAALTDSYVYTNYLKDDAIQTDVSDGVVHLTGSVTEESHRVLAGDTAESIPGVMKVTNDLLTNEEVADAGADTWIGRKVKMSLLFHRNVSWNETEVAVKDGVVTLTGTASSLAQKELTTEYAQGVEGVVKVDNRMAVVAEEGRRDERSAGEKIDDASITAQVKSALANHRSTRTIATKVSTLDGKVTLTGIAKNDAEKALVSKLVDDIKGVSSVNNEMTIQAPKTS